MTEAEYLTALARIEAENGGEILLPELRRGHSPGREIYLRAALRRLPEPISDPEADDSQRDGRDDDAQDPVLAALWCQIRRLKMESRKLSNSFHDCKTSGERLAVSVALTDLDAPMAAIYAKMEVVKSGCDLPPEVEDERFPLSDDLFELSQKLRSIRSMISQAEKTLRDLAALPDHHPEKTARVAKAEKRRAELELYRGHAETKIKNLQRG